MEKGIILKGVGGNYEVKTGLGVFNCTLRGRLRLQKDKILVGDRVEISREENGGVVERVLPRKNLLKRPPIANVDQVVLVFAVENPQASLLLLDRLLVHAHLAQIQSIIVFNKKDLNPARAAELFSMYAGLSYQVLTTSALTGEGLHALSDIFKEKISTLAGPSGVGKSSLLNALHPTLDLETKEVSTRIQRGRHTTRTVHLLPLAGGYVADTPGFSQMAVSGIAAQELQYSFPEIAKLTDSCRFRGCLHRREPGCAVKQGLQDGLVLVHRYEHYLTFLEEIEAVPHYLKRGDSH